MEKLDIVDRLAALAWLIVFAWFLFLGLASSAQTAQAEGNGG